MALQGKLYSRIFRNVLFLVIPFVAISLFLFSSYERSVSSQASLRLQAEQQRGVLIIGNQIESAFSQFVSDLLVVYNSNEFSSYTQNVDEQSLLDVARLFVRITTQKEYILSQRFIGADGRELVQVDRRAGNYITLAERQELEDLGRSELFRYTRFLAPRVLHISGVSVETDENDQERTIITLALPAYQGSKFLGVVAIDFDACYLFSFLSAYQSSLQKDLNFLLIDTDGDVVLTGDAKCPDVYADERNLFSDVPALRKLFIETTQGSRSVDEVTYTFQAVYPKTSERLSWSPGPVRLWTLVSYFEESQLPDLADNFWLDNPLIKYGLAFLILALGTALVVFQQLRAGDKQQMRISSLIAGYANNGIVVCNAEGSITFCNKAFEELSGYSQEYLIGKTSPRMRNEANPISSSHGDTVANPAWVLHHSGQRFLTHLSITTITDRRSRVEHTIEIYENSKWTPARLTSLRNGEATLPHQFHATILPSFPEDQMVACLCFHLENTREVETRLSQAERVLFSSNFASTLANLIGSRFPVYCFSLDYYVLFMEHEGPSEAFGKRMKSILVNLSEPYPFHSGSLPVRLGCGVAFKPSTSTSVFALLSDAALASTMIESRKNGPLLFCSEEVRSQFQRQNAIREALEGVFKTDQLSLHYQAQVSVASAKIIGAEALIRWHHPELGSIRPDEFLPMLKDQGRLDQLGRFVITESIEFLHRNRKTLENLCPSFSLALNLSAEELSNPALIDQLGALLRQYHIPDDMLSVELTEHTAVESFVNTNSILEKLHAQGIAIAIDDFGTGFSSLSYLLELSADKIKIDRSFISRYPESESITIYKTVLLLAKEVGAVVLAEGVEDEQQLAFLTEIGCDEYQGYLFSPAVNEQAFLTQLDEVNQRT